MATYDIPPTPSDLSHLLLSRPVCSLPVTDISAAIEYWTTKLPFCLRGRDGNNHCWVSSFDEEVNVYLRRRGYAGPGRAPLKNDAKFGQLSVRVALINGPWDSVAAEAALRALNATLTTRGALVVTSVKRMPWGQWICGFADPDGNLISFYAEDHPSRRGSSQT